MTSSVWLGMCFCVPGLPHDPHTTPEKPTPLPNMCGRSLESSTMSPNAQTFAPGEVSRDQRGRIWVESNQSSSDRSCCVTGNLWFQSQYSSVLPSVNTGQTGFVAFTGLLSQSLDFSRVTRPFDEGESWALADSSHAPDHFHAQINKRSWSWRNVNNMTFCKVLVDPQKTILIITWTV